MERELVVWVSGCSATSGFARMARGTNLIMKGSEMANRHVAFTVSFIDSSVQFRGSVYCTEPNYFHLLHSSLFVVLPVVFYTILVWPLRPGPSKSIYFLLRNFPLPRALLHQQSIPLRFINVLQIVVCSVSSKLGTLLYSNVHCIAWNYQYESRDKNFIPNNSQLLTRQVHSEFMFCTVQYSRFHSRLPTQLFLDSCVISRLKNTTAP